MSDDEKRRAPRTRGLSEVFREARRVVESAGLDLQELAETVVSSAKELADSAADAATSARTAIDRASTNARELSVQVRGLIGFLEQAPEADRASLVERFVEAMPLVATQLDGKADAFAIGQLGEAGVGLQAVQGVELRYIRGPAPSLVVARIEGRGARLAAGAAKLAYAGALYGDARVLSEPLSRRGADVGIALAGFRFFRATALEAQAVGGWWLVLFAGLNLGVPILSDLGAFELSDEIANSHALMPDEVTRIESALAEAPDRTWRRGMAQQIAQLVSPVSGR